MENYIDILLKSLDEHDREYLGWEYCRQSERAMEAMKALERTLSPEQKDLLQAYEDRRMAADDTRERTLARQAFLLAREIYR